VLRGRLLLKAGFGQEDYSTLFAGWDGNSKVCYGVYLRMKISYRVTSFAVLSLFLAQILAPASFFVKPQPSALSSGDGGASFDFCSAWEQIGWVIHLSVLLIRLSALVWMATFLPLFFQGLRNRTLPRAFAVASLIAVGPFMHNRLWWVQRCESSGGVAMFALWVAAVCAASIHHLIQRPPNYEITGSKC